MNDFTKEELEYLADGMALLIGQKSLAKKLDASIMSVFEKIEAMIDDYVCDKCDARK